MKTKLFKTAAAVLFTINSFAETSLSTFYNQKTNIVSFKMKIKGDSNIKLWESDVTKIDGVAQFEGNNISSMTLDIDVKGIKSGKDGMDDKTYDAMNADKHPKITYTLSKVISTDDKKIVTEGDITINGVTRKEQIESDITIEGNNLILKGSKKIKMSDFKISPPTALLGTIKCKDDLEIVYEFNFSK